MTTDSTKAAETLGGHRDALHKEAWEYGDAIRADMQTRVCITLDTARACGTIAQETYVLAHKKGHEQGRREALEWVLNLVSSDPEITSLGLLSERIAEALKDG